MAHQRALNELHERNQHHIFRDTRTLGQRIVDFMKNPRAVAFLMLAFMILTYVCPVFSELCVFVGLGVVIFCFTREKKLPFKMPQRSGLSDHNDTMPGSDKPRKARGIYHLGNEKSTEDELWFNNDDMRTHALIFGSTGSGKTEMLISVAYNALLQASGFIYVDGKGDNALFSKLFSMVRSMGREDDMLLINFMTGARDVIGPQERRLSNTLNPFARGSSSMLAQLVVSLMDGSSSSSDGDMWKGRAIGFVEALMKVLVPMRDAGHILLDANVIRNYFHLPRLEAIVLDKVFIRDGQESISLENMPETIIEPLKNYVLTLPGFNPEKKGKQVSQVLEQHGFITMQLVRVFTSLADTYGHILRTNLAEVDLSDVVLNRRILCVLLPALEKSPDELSQLGKVIIATLKAMMAAGLGDHVEGDLADIVDSRPTNAETPYLCILDEYGYYAVEGFAVVPAQARSLGFSVVFAGQDLPAFQKASKEEAASIGANTNIKICMKLEDPTETWDFFMKSAGESYVSQVENFQVDSNSLLGNYQDGKGARMEKRARVDLLDLKEQAPGEYHLFFKSKIVRGKTFFANPTPVKRMRLNQFLKVDSPEDNDVERFQQSMESFNEIAQDKTFLTQVEASNEEVDKLTNLLAVNGAVSAPMDRSLLALQQFSGVGQGVSTDSPFAAFFEDSEPSWVEADEYDEDGLNLFASLTANQHIKDLLSAAEIEGMKMPIVSRAQCRDQFEYLGRLAGQSSQQAMNVALELTADMHRCTAYPPENIAKVPTSNLVSSIDRIIEKIALKQSPEGT